MALKGWKSGDYLNDAAEVERRLRADAERRKQDARASVREWSAWNTAGLSEAEIEALMDALSKGVAPADIVTKAVLLDVQPAPVGREGAERE